MLFYKLLGLEETFYADPQMYNCSGTEDIRHSNIPIGILYLFLGIFYQCCYIPCIIVMARPPLINAPCFKIMVYLGIVDVLCLFICADMAGIWSITGQPFCTSPTEAYILGNFAMGFWSATCLCCIILAFNRATDLVFPKMNHVFDGERIYFWLLLPTVYFVFFTFFERPLLFDPSSSTFFFDPLSNHSTSLPVDLAHKIYANVPHTVNNMVVIFALVFFYLVIGCRLVYKAHQSNVDQLSSMTKQIIPQLMIICGCHVVGCFLYVYTQYFQVPQVFTILGNLAWMGNHGFPGVVYLTLNRTIRHKVLILMGWRKTKDGQTKIVGVNSNSNNLPVVQ